MFKSFHKEKYLFLVALFFASHLSFSQTLTFCESVDNSGAAKNASSSFKVNTNGGLVNMLVTLPHELNSAFVTYDLFLVNEENIETFENTIKHDVHRDYVWFRKEITFHKAGAYNVYVYDDKDRMLCMGRVTISIQ